MKNIKKRKKAKLIKGLKNEISFKKAAKIITNFKLRNLIFLINRYFEDETVENLHDLRIAIRRLRYSIESFYGCFSEKPFKDFYKSLSLLQDKLGEARDLDVMSEKLNYFEEHYGITISENLHSEMEIKRKEYKVEIISLLKNFLTSEITKKFLINK